MRISDWSSDVCSSDLGILGGGQLGRMLAVAAAQLGYRTHIYAPDRESVAAHVAAHHTQAAWDDEPRLAAFAAAFGAVTHEFETVPVDPRRLDRKSVGSGKRVVLRLDLSGSRNIKKK